MKSRMQLRMVLWITVITVLFILSSAVISQEKAPAVPDKGNAVVKEEAPAEDVKASEALSAEQGIKEPWTETIFGLGMVPLWICSIFLIALILERWKALKADNIIDEKMMEEVVECVSKGNVKKAHEITKGNETVLGKAWAQGFHEFILGGVSLYEGLTNSTVLAFKPLKRNLQAISTIAVISPLLGLLGTVVGMIITFNQISATGGADKTELAGGIGLALFTTAGGLIVAIPAIVSGRFFMSRLTGYAEQAESVINRINYRYSHSQAKGADSTGGSKEGSEEELKDESADSDEGENNNENN